MIIQVYGDGKKKKSNLQNIPPLGPQSEQTLNWGKGCDQGWIGKKQNKTTQKYFIPAESVVLLKSNQTREAQSPNPLGCVLVQFFGRDTQELLGWVRSCLIQGPASDSQQ